MINYDREKEYQPTPLFGTLFTLFLVLPILIITSIGMKQMYDSGTDVMDSFGTYMTMVIFIFSVIALFVITISHFVEVKEYNSCIKGYEDIVDTSNKFQTSFNAYKLLDFDLRVLSIKTPDGKDIRDFGYVYMSELKNYYKYYLEFEDHPNSKFVIERHNYRSNYLIDSIIEIYLNESPMGLRYNSSGNDSRFYQPIEKRDDEFNLTRELDVENIEVIY